MLKQIDELIRIRKYLHTNPELSGQEFRTAEYIYNNLKKTKANEVIKISNTGVVAVFESEKAGETTLFRADIDALPIQEENNFEYRSVIANVSHKCGHDGHTTILLGVAQNLSENPISGGKVILLFQPAEENGEGAKSALAHSFFKRLVVNQVFALHNLPGFPLKEIVIKEGVFTANVISLTVKLTGKTAHAAEPEMGQNPSVAIAKIILEANRHVNNKSIDPAFFVITAVHSHIGEEGYGVSAGLGEVHFTMRAWDKKLLSRKCKGFEKYINEVCSAEELEVAISWTQEFNSSSNSKKAIELISKVAERSNLSVSKLETPFKWGEDFGLFTHKYEGAMFGLGAGKDTPALHTTDYDFPDEIIPTGIKIFGQIIEEIHE
ncbi:MAG: amidohydrolase [Vicingaceae bacterium]|jgi:amidohydrolase